MSTTASVSSFSKIKTRCEKAPPGAFSHRFLILHVAKDDALAVVDSGSRGDGQGSGGAIGDGESEGESEGGGGLSGDGPAEGGADSDSVDES